MRQLIDERQAVLEVTSLPQLQGSRIQISQLLQNLITNAIRYCPADRQPEIRLSALEIPDGWEFALADNGEGIPAEAREQIFEPFKRYSQKRVAGSGLGLSICRRIVQAHGGNIYCEANIEDGTTFIFTLKEQKQ